MSDHVPPFLKTLRCLLIPFRVKTYSWWWPKCPAGSSYHVFHRLLFSPGSLILSTLAFLKFLKHSGRAPILRCSDCSFCLKRKQVLPSAVRMANFLLSFTSCFKCPHLNEDDFGCRIKFTGHCSPQSPPPWLSWVPLTLAFSLFFCYCISKWLFGLCKSLTVKGGTKSPRTGHGENVPRHWKNPTSK